MNFLLTILRDFRVKDSLVYKNLTFSYAPAPSVTSKKTNKTSQRIPVSDSKESFTLSIKSLLDLYFPLVKSGEKFEKNVMLSLFINTNF